MCPMWNKESRIVYMAWNLRRRYCSGLKHKWKDIDLRHEIWKPAYIQCPFKMYDHCMDSKIAKTKQMIVICELWFPFVYHRRNRSEHNAYKNPTHLVIDFVSFCWINFCSTKSMKSYGLRQKKYDKLLKETCNRDGTPHSPSKLKRCHLWIVPASLIITKQYHHSIHLHYIYYCRVPV